MQCEVTVRLGLPACNTHRIVLWDVVFLCKGACILALQRCWSVGSACVVPDTVHIILSPLAMASAFPGLTHFCDPTCS